MKIILKEICISKSVDDEIVLLNILREYLDFFQNHAWLLFIAKWIDCFLLLQSSWYFFTYYSLLKWYFQNRHRFELAWWLSLQFKHLKVWVLWYSKGWSSNILYIYSSEFYIRFYFEFTFLLLYWWWQWRGMWHGGHMTCHMMWFHKSLEWSRVGWSSLDGWH